MGATSGFVLEADRLDERALRVYVERAQDLGYAFATLADRTDVERIYGVHQACRKRQPPLETHQEPQDYERWRALWAGAHPELYHVLLRNAEPIGVCGLVETDALGTFECGFTGVLPAYSRRGLAVAVKSSALLGAKAAGASRIVARVHPDNAAMLKANRRLGFVPADGESP